MAADDSGDNVGEIRVRIDAAEFTSLISDAMTASVRRWHRSRCHAPASASGCRGRQGFVNKLGALKTHPDSLLNLPRLRCRLVLPGPKLIVDAESHQVGAKLDGVTSLDVV